MSEANNLCGGWQREHGMHKTDTGLQGEEEKVGWIWESESENMYFLCKSEYESMLIQELDNFGAEFFKKYDPKINMSWRRWEEIRLGTHVHCEWINVIMAIMVIVK